MGRRNSKSEADDGEKPPPYYFVHVTDELRTLANELVTIFDDLLSTKGSITIGGSEIKKKISWCKELVVLTLLEGTQSDAIKSLSKLGTLKIELFPSPPEDYYQRCRERDNIRRVRAAGVPLSAILCDANLNRIPLADPHSLSPGGWLSPEYKRDEFLCELKARDPKSVTLAELERLLSTGPVEITQKDVLDRKYGPDPLEEPDSLTGGSTPKSELLIFLEHYLPYELADIARIIADTDRNPCEVDAPFVVLLTEFHRCFDTFPIIRTSLLRENRKLSRFIDGAHHTLLRLAKILKNTASPTSRNKAHGFEGNQRAASEHGSLTTNPQMHSEELMTLPSEHNFGRENTHATILATKALGDYCPLHIKIEKSPSEHFRFVASGGEIHSHQLSQKRTLVVIALLMEGKRTITPGSFCKLYYGEAGKNASARFSDSIKKAGLRQYRTDEPPYRFPHVNFDWTDISEDELKAYLTETVRQ